MRIYTRAGDLAFSTFTFPDGQPHFKLETYEREFDSVTIETRIASPTELFQVGMVVSVLRESGYASINLDIRYLMGARMDRAISSGEPFTLQLVARFLNSLGLAQVRVLDVHSSVATRLIRHAENVLPLTVVKQAVLVSGAQVIVVPDKGAAERAQRVWYDNPGTTIIHCDKVRDMATGKLSNFKVNNYEPEKDGTSVLIVDDICDGGATFVGLAKVLKEAGARKVFLYVTHGIFSKGTAYMNPLIEHIFTTNSYHGQPDKGWEPNVTVIPVCMEKL